MADDDLLIERLLRVIDEGLRDLQHGCCFYCGDVIAGRGQVDHFLAWSRWPNDAIENLVLADRCNGAKSDHLAVTGHLDRWQTRAHARRSELVDIASTSRWQSDAERTRALISTTYAHLAPATPLWLSGTAFESAPGPIFFSS